MRRLLEIDLSSAIYVSMCIYCIYLLCVNDRWNFSVGNFELKFLPETQSGRNFLEGELSSTNGHRESQRIMREEDWQEVEQQQQHLDLVIKVSVPDWKVMAFSTGPEVRLVWEHQVSSPF